MPAALQQWRSSSAKCPVEDPAARTQRSYSSPPSPSPLPPCLAEGSCTYQTIYQGISHSFDFRRLCDPGRDYILSDGLGHTYSAQICGTAWKECLPATWENQYQFGNVIQSWGSPPPCNNRCVDGRTGQPICCTEDCQVIAVAKPTFSTVVQGDPTQGLQLTYIGETPTASDPYKCPIDPSTGAPYPRVTHMQFYCDAGTTGFANLFEASQNATEGCEYYLKFKTSLACVNSGGLSGGWVFNIIVMVAVTVYLGAGSFLNYRNKGTWEVPNKSFWAEVESLIMDGMAFLLFGCKKPGSRRLPVGEDSSKGFGSTSSVSSSSADSSSSAAGAAAFTGSSYNSSA